MCLQMSDFYRVQPQGPFSPLVKWLETLATLVSLLQNVFYDILSLYCSRVRNRDEIVIRFKNRLHVRYSKKLSSCCKIAKAYNS